MSGINALLNSVNLAIADAAPMTLSLISDFKVYSPNSAKVLLSERKHIAEIGTILERWG